uniref:Transposase n=1 Tax=Ascaris lumbricoides TaxID=6252 RepID=A0A0M3I3S5_ASCLU
MKAVSTVEWFFAIRVFHSHEKLGNTCSVKRFISSAVIIGLDWGNKIEIYGGNCSAVM